MAFAASVENYGSDTTTYLLLARSILEEGSYRFNFELHTVYPPGYPLVLAGLMALGIDSWTGLIRATIPLYFAGLWGAYHLFRRLSDRRIAAVATLLTATSHGAFFWTTAGLLSEGSYFACSVGALVSIEEAIRSKSRGRRIAMVALTSIFMSFLPLIRTIGVALLGGLALWTLAPILRPGGRSRGAWRDRVRRWSPALALALITVAGWVSWAGRHDPGYAGDAYMGSYFEQVMKSDPHVVDSPEMTPSQMPERFARLLAIRAQRMTQTLLNQPWWDLSYTSPISLVLLLLVSTGLGRSMWLGPSVLDLYVLAYVGMLLVWPFDEGNRFLIPILPFLFFYAVRGLGLFLGLLRTPVSSRFPARRRIAQVGAFGIVCFIVAGGLYHSAETARDYASVDPATFRVYPTVLAAEWIRENTPENAVVMDEQAAILHRLSGRKTYRFPLMTDPVGIRDLILDTGTDFVVVLDERPFEYFLPSVAQRFADTQAAFPDLFSLVHEFDFGCVCKVHGG